MFYLTHPAVTAAVSRLEAEGAMYAMTDRVAEDPELAERYRAAHEDYLAQRRRIGELAGTGDVPEIEGISAGGMPTRVKCLHVLVGHSLASGPGVNPLGDETLAMIADTWTPRALRVRPRMARRGLTPRPAGPSANLPAPPTRGTLLPCA